MKTAVTDVWWRAVVELMPLLLMLTSPRHTLPPKPTMSHRDHTVGYLPEPNCTKTKMTRPCQLPVDARGAEGVEDAGVTKQTKINCESFVA
jgi:hypothetical protein